VLKDKSFFFFGYEGFRLRQGSSYTYSVPTDAQRSGDFSNVGNGSGALETIYYPPTTCARLGNATCATNALGAEGMTRTPFTGNDERIRFDPTGLACIFEQRRRIPRAAHSDRDGL